uniref:histocompatibility antigen 60b-like n=1 Tax=Arvicanthis niloticus TaxID=61156 RepID=UPI00148600AF|nr:histocompatibility antigen 60b-like [Arvicanthis niloticus]XP_034347980.1 histocompatibility antigen 60b-like [Arvicanthis niloticus]
MRNQLRNMGTSTLQVAMKSQYNHGQLIDAFCNFIIDGKSFFSFNSTNNTWTGSGPDDEDTMRQWERNREVNQGLTKLLRGDFSHCYKEMWTLWKETPRSTMKAWAITQHTSATHTLPTVNSAQSTSGTQSRDMTWVVILHIAGLIFIALIT